MYSNSMKHKRLWHETCKRLWPFKPRAEKHFASLKWPWTHFCPFWTYHKYSDSLSQSLHISGVGYIDFGARLENGTSKHIDIWIKHSIIMHLDVSAILICTEFINLNLQLFNWCHFYWHIKYSYLSFIGQVLFSWWHKLFLLFRKILCIQVFSKSGW